MKKLCAFLLALAMLLSLASFAAAEEPMTIQWQYDAENPPTADDWFRDELEAKFNVKFEPVTLSFVNQYSDFYQLEWSAGKSYDYYTGGGLSLGNLGKMAEQKLIMPLDKEMIKANMPNLMAWLEKYGYGDGAFDYFTIDEQLYAIPAARPDNTYRMVLGIRGDWLENVGLEVPQTIEQWEEVLDAFTYGDPDGNGEDDTYGYTGVNWLSYAISPFTNTFGCMLDGWYIKDGQPVYGNVQPEMKQALALMNKWYKAGYFAPGVFTNSWDEFRNDMITEKAGVALQSYYCFVGTTDLWMIGDLVKVNPDAYYELSAGIKGEDGQYGVLQFNPFITGGISFDYKMADQPEKLAKYMQIFDTVAFSKEYQADAFWGKKDIGWTVDENGVYTEIKLPDDSTDGPTPTSNFTYGQLAMNMYDPILVADFEQKDQVSKDLQKYAASIGTGLYDISGCVTAARPMNDQYGAALGELTNAYIIPIITGERPLDDFDQYVKEWYTSGGTEVEAEMQTILNSFGK